MPRSPLFVIDIDGVVADYAYHYLNTIANQFGSAERPIAVHGAGGQRQWDLRENPNVGNDAGEWIFNPDNIGGGRWFEDVPSLVTPGDRIGLQMLAERGRVEFVTQRPVWAQNVTICWLNDRLPGVRFGVTFSKNKCEGIAEIEERHDCRARAVIDDKPRVLKELYAGGHNVFVRDWPYNRPPHIVQAALGDPPIWRVGSLEEFCHAALNLTR